MTKPEDHSTCRTNQDGICVGYHCGGCGKPSSYQGHYLRERYTKKNGDIAFRGEWKFRCPK